MAEPLQPWGSQDLEHPRLIWGSRVDKRYQVEVQRTGDYTAELCIFDHEQDNRCIHTAEVDLSYGAIFGPDACDVAFWQDLTLGVIDSM